MAISRKPIKGTNNHTKKDLIEEIINKGGSSAIDHEQTEHKYATQLKITVRLPAKVIQIIDLYVKDSMSTTTRNQFIKEAIADKLNKLKTQDIIDDYVS
ncbi:hypothetical protein Cyrtocomes_01178 [Candidatus Cyrtobacter comes]|uniref:Ribbon-helix-helix protein CopG domain-containing protein n=1 Tax=Candidatus Cyrtobacter comes TaxID=675776 RepID=A0ABU5L9I4_9RICK|nr:hypothetical protein [Candidatus Cyrtobacter comes]MDZ5762783.1 hypothetical protein [Candidatus Cyrtobacter comes]